MLRETDLTLGASNCIIKWGNLKAGENFLLLADTKVSRELISAVASVAKLHEANVSVMVKEPADLPHQEPEKIVAEAMKASDLTVGCLTNSISHTSAAYELECAGGRFINLGSSVEAMSSQSAKFPPEIVFLTATKIAQAWKQGRTLRLTCDRGSDLTATMYPELVIGEEGAGAPLGTKTIEGKPRRSRFGAFEGGFGTVGYWPRWSTNGTVYFDAAHGIEGMLKTPLKTEIVDGRVEKLDGDPDVVAHFERMFERFGDEARHIGEIMMGLNPWVDVVAGLQAKQHVQAHRAAGTVHICFGNSIDDDRSVRPGIHLDQLVIKPTLYIDDEVCIDGGRVVFYEENEEVKRLADSFNIVL